MKKLIKNIMPKSVLFWYNKTRYIRNMLETSEERLKRRNLLRFDVHLVEHCNLNCKGCQHFSTLAEKTFLDIEIFKRDCTRLSELTAGRIDEMAILGGEPLLHPRIHEFLKTARFYFPAGRILILTNGTCLLKIRDEFWQACKENNIEINISSYPIELNVSAIKEQAKNYGVPLTYHGDSSNQGRNWMRYPLDITGGGGVKNLEWNFRVCEMADHCYQLVDGKIFQCATSAYIKFFNKYFNQNLEVSKEDYIDIYKVKNVDEILDWLTKPIPFCRYCRIKDMVLGLEWGKSKKLIGEWTSKKRTI